MTITRTRVDPQEMEDWTEAELEHYLLGPFDGEIPGLVRRVRRILDVSQRGLAAMLGISQSQVARWETRRTSPRADLLTELLRLANCGSSSATRRRARWWSPCETTGPAIGLDVATRRTSTSR